MLLKLCQAGTPVLRQKAKTVSKSLLASKETQQFIDYMIETLRDAPGVGLAAPQVGSPLRICIVEDKVKYHKPVPPEVLKEQGRKAIPLKVLVNPQLEIIEAKPVLHFEGCLSVEGYLAAVPRATKVKVTALDRTGKPVSYTASGWFARILQHEIDHLNGALYIDRANMQSFMTLKNYAKFWREALQAEIAKAFI